MDLIEKNESTKYRHPWEISRRDSILTLINKKDNSIQYADIGAGDLFFVSSLLKYTNKPIYAVDINYQQNKTTEKIIQSYDINDIHNKSIDCILLMDILEHIEDENEFLQKILGLLKKDGKIIITVPAFKFMFSDHDKFLKHYRRYNAKQLINLLKINNIKIKEVFYFYSILFFIRFIKIIYSKIKISSITKHGIGNWNFSNKNIITIILTKILNVDFLLNRYMSKIGILLPGLSLCIICQKKYA